MPSKGTSCGRSASQTAHLRQLSKKRPDSGPDDSDTNAALAGLEHLHISSDEIPSRGTSHGRTTSKTAQLRQLGRKRPNSGCDDTLNSVITRLEHLLLSSDEMPAEDTSHGRTTRHTAHMRQLKRPDSGPDDSITNAHTAHLEHLLVMSDGFIQALEAKVLDLDTALQMQKDHSDQLSEALTTQRDQCESLSHALESYKIYSEELLETIDAEKVHSSKWYKSLRVERRA